MPTFKVKDLKQELIEPEYSEAKGCTIRGQQIGIDLFSYPSGTKVKPHASPHEQILSVMKGKAKYRVGDEEKVVGPGEAVLIRTNTDHSAEILEDLEGARFQNVGEGSGEEREGTGGKAFFRWAEMESDFITPKYSKGKGPTIRGERIEVALMNYPTGPEGKPHVHPNEQLQIILKGKVKTILGGEISINGPGEIILKPANVPHTGQILEEYTVINCKNIVPGWSVYHARWEK
jgi:quercetin dioxygenase-like cupin family protein